MINGDFQKSGQVSSGESFRHGIPPEACCDLQDSMTLW